MLKPNALGNLGWGISEIQWDLLVGCSEPHTVFQIPVSEHCYNPTPYHNQN